MIPVHQSVDCSAEPADAESDACHEASLEREALPELVEPRVGAEQPRTRADNAGKCPEEDRLHTDIGHGGGENQRVFSEYDRADLDIGEHEYQRCETTKAREQRPGIEKHP